MRPDNLVRILRPSSVSTWYIPPECTLTTVPSTLMLSSLATFYHSPLETPSHLATLESDLLPFENGVLLDWKCCSLKLKAFTYHWANVLVNSSFSTLERALSRSSGVSTSMESLLVITIFTLYPFSKALNCSNPSANSSGPGGSVLNT